MDFSKQRFPLGKFLLMLNCILQVISDLNATSSQVSGNDTLHGAQNITLNSGNLNYSRSSTNACIIICKCSYHVYMHIVYIYRQPVVYTRAFSCMFY